MSNIIYHDFYSGPHLFQITLKKRTDRSIDKMKKRKKKIRNSGVDEMKSVTMKRIEPNKKTVRILEIKTKIVQ